MTGRFFGDFHEEAGVSGEGDEIDKANALAQVFTDRSVMAARGKAAPEQVVAADGSWPHPDCIDCGEPIPPLRLQLGKIRCVDCQAVLERGRWLQ